MTEISHIGLNNGLYRVGGRPIHWPTDLSHNPDPVQSKNAMTGLPKDATSSVGPKLRISVSISVIPSLVVASRLLLSLNCC